MEFFWFVKFFLKHYKMALIIFFIFGSYGMLNIRNVYERWLVMLVESVHFHGTHSSAVGT